MIALITILISILGYGTPVDYSDHTEAQLHTEIYNATEAQANQDGGGTGGWDSDH